MKCANLMALTTQPGQLVLDPFCGSGSTLVAAKAAGRRYLGYELDSESAKTALDRLQPDMFDREFDRETTDA